MCIYTVLASPTHVVVHGIIISIRTKHIQPTQWCTTGCTSAAQFVAEVQNDLCDTAVIAHT
jgi:hypothetical protein